MTVRNANFEDMALAADMLNEVDVPEVEGGDVSVDNETPATGEDVTITVNPEPGKEVDQIVVKDENGNELGLFIQNGVKYMIKRQKFEAFLNDASAI